jgi:hypothetical protein
MKLLIKFPSRDRPEKFKYSLSQYINKCENKKDTFFLFTFDEDDKTMNNYRMKQIISEFCEKMNYFIVYGNSGNKIKAINRDLENFPFWEILLLASDDMIPEVQGYDEIIRKNMKQFFPDLDGVLWFNDGYQREKLNTLVCVGSAYYKRFNYIYNPIYKSFFCDNEFMDIANKLKRQKYFNNVIIRHQHPSNNFSVQDDELYRKNDKYWKEDKSTYEKRRKEIFLE